MPKRLETEATATTDTAPKKKGPTTWKDRGEVPPRVHAAAPACGGEIDGEKVAEHRRIVKAPRSKHDRK